MKNRLEECDGYSNALVSRFIRAVAAMNIVHLSVVVEEAWVLSVMMNCEYQLRIYIWIFSLEDTKVPTYLTLTFRRSFSGREYGPLLCTILPLSCYKCSVPTGNGR